MGIKLFNGNGELFLMVKAPAFFFNKNFRLLQNIGYY